MGRMIGQQIPPFSAKQYRQMLTEVNFIKREDKGESGWINHKA